MSQFYMYKQPLSNLRLWQETLQILLSQLQNFDFVTDVVSTNAQRLLIMPSVHFVASQYIFQFDKLATRLEWHLREISYEKIPLLNL